MFVGFSISQVCHIIPSGMGWNWTTIVLRSRKSPIVKTVGSISHVDLGKVIEYDRWIWEPQHRNMKLDLSIVDMDAAFWIHAIFRGLRIGGGDRAPKRTTIPSSQYYQEGAPGTLHTPVYHGPIWKTGKNWWRHVRKSLQSPMQQNPPAGRLEENTPGGAWSRRNWKHKRNGKRPLAGTSSPLTAVTNVPDLSRRVSIDFINWESIMRCNWTGCVYVELHSFHGHDLWFIYNKGFHVLRL